MKAYLEPIRNCVEEAIQRGFKASGEPYLDMKVQGGWVVNGTADFHTVGKTGKGWSHTGWVFDNKADATNFYNEFRRTPDQKNKEVLDNFFSKIKV